MSEKVRKIPKDVLMSTNPMMSPDQLEGLIWGAYYRTARTRDRGPESMVKTNHASGLPESSNDLLPNHRATYGTELALVNWFVPRKFVMACLYTDEHPKNLGRPHDQKEWMALTYVKPENWSDETNQAFSENLFRTRLLLSKLGEQGLFITTPNFAEDGNTAELGTDRLVHGEDGLPMAAKITYKGLQYADDFVREHSFLGQGHTILDAMGREEFLSEAPEWKKRELANQAIDINT